MQGIADLIAGADSLIVEEKVVAELRSMIYIFENGQYVGFPLPAAEQLSSINDFEVNGEGRIFYVGNNHAYVAELGPSLANPGRVLWNFDSAKNNFSNSEDLPLPLNVVFRKISSIADNKLIAVSNQDKPYIISRKSN